MNSLGAELGRSLRAQLLGEGGFALGYYTSAYVSQGELGPVAPGGVGTEYNRIYWSLYVDLGDTLLGGVKNPLEDSLGEVVGG